MFIILNEDGQVLSWQFTKTKSFEEVKTLILQVSKRMTGFNKNVSTIYIDDCCSWRQLLQSSLGYEVNVKLDLFHAVQRITKHLGKKHKHYFSCLSHLKLVFRDDGDVQLSRSELTPSPAGKFRKLCFGVVKFNV